MFNFNNNSIFGYFASSGGITESLFEGTSAQTFYRNFVSRQLNGSPPDRLGPQINFRRDSTATYYNSAGIITYASINQPRFDYSPNGIYRGLLIEETRANTFWYSTNFALNTPETWVTLSSSDGPGVTLTLISTISAPDNSTTATLLSARPAKGYRGIVGAGKADGEDLISLYTRSIFIKQNVGRYAVIGTINPIALSNQVNANNFRIFDFEAKNFIQSSEGGSLHDSNLDLLYAEEHPNDWIRIGFSRASGNTSINKLFIGTALTSAWESGLYTNTEDRDSFYIWGAQYEKGGCMTSYIPATGYSGGTVRSADNVTTARLSATNVYNIQESSVYVKGSRLNPFLSGSFLSFAQNNFNYWKLAAQTEGLFDDSTNKRQNVYHGIYVNFVPDSDFFALTSLPTLSANVPYTLIGSVSTNSIDTTRFYYAQDQTLVKTYPLSTDTYSWFLTAEILTNIFTIPSTWPIYDGPNNESYFNIYVNSALQPLSAYQIEAEDRLLLFTSVTSLPIGTEISGVQIIKEYDSPVALDPKPTTFRLGQQFNSQYLNGHILEFGYWPKYLLFDTLSSLIYPTL